MSGRVNDVQEYFDTLEQRLTPECLKNVTAAYQFTPETAGTWHVNASEGSFIIYEGKAEKATTTLIMKGNDVIAMSLGQYFELCEALDIECVNHDYFQSKRPLSFAVNRLA